MNGSLAVVALLILASSLVNLHAADGGTESPTAPAVHAKTKALKAKARRPVWASDAGVDEQGDWADLRVGSVTQRMRFIPAGTFTMGCSTAEAKVCLAMFMEQSGAVSPGLSYFDNSQQHQVTLTSPFWLADSPVTQELWKEVMGTEPSDHKGAGRPVENVSWNVGQAFFSATNARIVGLRAFFPTEAQWEYACRAGTTTAAYGQPDDIAWYAGNGGKTTHRVKQKLPNAWGLYDMLGNVHEHVADFVYRYTGAAQTDPTGGSSEGTNKMKMLRGASFSTGAYNIRAAWRGNATGDAGWNELGLRMCAPYDNSAPRKHRAPKD